MMGIKIRPTQLDDLPALDALYDTPDKIGVQRSAWERRITGQLLEQNLGMSQVAEANDTKIIGSIFAADTGRRGMIHHLYVLPEYRRQGIGSSLFQAAERAVVDRGRKALAVGIVREEYRDAFCEHIGLDLGIALPMWQADLAEGQVSTEVSATSSDFVIRPLHPTDLPQLSLLAARCSEACLRGCDQIPTHYRDLVLVCMCGGAIAGLLIGESSGLRGVLVDFAIDPRFRGSNAGTELVSKFHELLTTAGIFRVLAAGRTSDDYRNAILEKSGYQPLPDEMIARKILL